MLGAFQRGHGLKRGSGGGAVLVGPGRIWVSLALTQSSALVPDASPDKLLNRYVRPLLRALGKVTNTPASYFGRDWVSVAHRPVAFVGFAHDGETGRALFEAIVAVRAPFAAGSSPSFMGKAPATLSDVSKRSLDDDAAVIAAIEDAYVSLAPNNNRSEVRLDAAEAEKAVEAEEAEEAPWLATGETAMGTIGCGPDRTGRLRIGGDLMASADAIRRLEDALRTNPTSDDVLEEMIDEAFDGAVLFGATRAEIRDVIALARTSLAERSKS